MTRSQKRYAIDQYNKARFNRGLSSIQNPFSWMGNNQGNPIYKHTDGVEYITEPSTSKNPNSFTNPGPHKEAPDVGFDDTQLNEAIQFLDHLTAHDLPPDDAAKILTGEFIFTGDLGQISTLTPNSNVTTPSTSGVKRPQNFGSEQVQKKPVDPAKVFPSFATSTTPTPPTAFAQMPSTRSQSQQQPSDGGSGQGAEPMDTGAQAAAQPKMGSAAKNIGGGTSTGGFDSMQGPTMYIERPMYRHSGGHMTFKKVHHMKCFALPFFGETLAKDSSNNYRVIKTPLMRVHWDRPYFYMSPEEYNLIPDGSHFVKAKCSVDIIGATVAFETGATTSTTSITGHPKIGFIGRDLDNKLRSIIETEGLVSFTNQQLMYDADNVGLTDTTINNFVSYQYGTDQNAADANEVISGVACGIPYWNFYNYTGYISDLRDGTTGVSSITARAPGIESLMSELDQFNINDATWSNVINQEYTFKYAPKGARFRALELGNVDNEIENFQLGNNFKHDTKIATEAHYNMVAAGIATAVDLNFEGDFSESGVSHVNYKAIIEQGAFNHIGITGTYPGKQPSIHLGMKAIGRPKAMNNTARADSFIPAYLNFVVTAEVVVATNNYPNRFTRPKDFNVNIENNVGGIGAHPEIGNITFGKYKSLPGANAPDTASYPTTRQLRRKPKKN